jgi:hypothetical protein
MTMAEMEYKNGALCVDKLSVSDIETYPIDSNEWIFATIDSSNKVINGTKQNGTEYFYNIESPTLDKINKTIDDNFTTLNDKIQIVWE